ncbi:MAG TPA: hypothetical protein VME24_00170 [Alphaproteobacteria bacterium]|nr:hypothetical protein [Alphaproteobacteria bacterium]
MYIHPCRRRLELDQPGTRVERPNCLAGSAPFSTPGESPLISWPFTTGLSYSVQFKDDLNDPAWHPLIVPVVFIGNRAWLYDAAPGSYQRFYCVMQGN